MYRAWSLGIIDEAVRVGDHIAYFWPQDSVLGFRHLHPLPQLAPDRFRLKCPRGVTAIAGDLNPTQDQSSGADSLFLARTIVDVTEPPESLLHAVS
jgi:hypothetical protein